MAKRPSGKWLSVIIAALVVGGLALYAASAGNKPIPTTSPLQSQAAAPAATATSTAPDATPAPAPDVSATPPATGSAVPGMSAGSLIGLLLKVGIVAALLALCLWALRRYAGSGPRLGGRTGAIQIVDTISVAQNRAFYVLDVGDRAVVVGATPQQLAVVAEITDEDVLARLRQKPEPAAAPLAGLWRQFNGMRERQNELRTLAQARSPQRDAEPAEPAPRRSRPAASPDASAAPAPARLQPENGASFARTLAAASIAQQAEPDAPRPPYPDSSAAQVSASPSAATPAAPRPRARTAAPSTTDDAGRARALSERLDAAQEPAR